MEGFKGTDEGVVRSPFGVKSRRVSWGTKISRTALLCLIGLLIPSHSRFYFQKDDLEASSSELSDGLAPSAEDKEEPQSRDALETRAVRKRTQTLPNRKCFESFSSNRRNQNMDRTDISSSNFWSSSSSSSMVRPGPNSPSGGHKRTLSQGISKLFSFTQASDSGCLRSLGQGTSREADNSSSGQLRDEFGPCLQTNDPPRSKENGTTILELPSEEDSLYPEDPELLRKMIAELKKELMAQKNSHEEQIRR